MRPAWQQFRRCSRLHSRVKLAYPSFPVAETCRSRNGRPAICPSPSRARECPRPRHATSRGKLGSSLGRFCGPAQPGSQAHPGFCAGAACGCAPPPGTEHRRATPDEGSATWRPCFGVGPTGLRGLARDLAGPRRVHTRGQGACASRASDLRLSLGPRPRPSGPAAAVWPGREPLGPVMTRLNSMRSA